MNPVMSDLEIFVRQQEIEVETRSLHRASFAREASTLENRQGWFRRMVDGVHRFVDPRGFALAQLRAEDSVTVAGAQVAGPVAAPRATVEAIPDAIDRVCPQPERGGQALAA